ncbi:MAG: phosphoribosylformylglycinamidine cyclo-ligase [Dehalococcoidia bacterium]|nr:phosphoribosylformylglycinamidine cyclo-ligase [Dehalococcoidia bacterium]
MKTKQVSPAYAAAGVNIDTAASIKSIIKGLARSTSVPGVLSEIGLFGGLFQLRGYKEPVLVASTDGVGTKLRIAALLGGHGTIGVDLVNHCVNDIFTCGASPLFFLDYIAMGKLVPQLVESIVAGMVKACRDTGCALLGGETAEMPGIYAPGDYDVVGFIVGAVEKQSILTGAAIITGDVLIGLPSSGLHTNGYSLARKVFEVDSRPAVLDSYYPELGCTLGEALLVPHRCYYHLLKPFLPLLKGMAHITGGGIPENLPRILPPTRAARIDSRSWPVPPLFSLIQRKGRISRREMFRVFNMGIGMILVCSGGNASQLLKSLPEARVIGQIAEQKGRQRVILA